MKILFINDEKGLINGLVAAINTHTTHTACRFNKLDQEWVKPIPAVIDVTTTEQPDLEETAEESYKETIDGEEVLRNRTITIYRKQQPLVEKTLVSPEVPGYFRYVQCPMTDPDVVICVDNYVTYEDLIEMGITTLPIRCLYITGAPPKRGGQTRMDARYRDFNKFYFGQTELDEDYFTYDTLDPITGVTSSVKLYDNITFLPLPVDTDSMTQATVRTDKLVVGMAQSQMVHAGAYTKGFHYLRPVHDAVRFDLELIFGLSRQEALDRKANCNMIWDSHMGNIGLSGLESLAQGLPVIGRFHPIVYENWERLSNGVPFPAVGFTDATELQSILQSYKDNPETLPAIGEASRNWMTTYATIDKIAQYWCNVIESKLNG